MKRYLKNWRWFCAVIAVPMIVHAANLAADSAANYGSSWSSGSNGGFGFGAWSITANADPNAGSFIGSSFNLGGGANINDASGNSFGLYANKYYNGSENSHNPYILANRSFTGGALIAKQDFSFKIAANYLNGSRGANVYSSSGTSFNIEGNSSGYVARDFINNASISLGGYAANTSFSVKLSQSSDNGGTWTVIRSGDISQTYSGSFTGALSSFQLYVGNANANSDASSQSSFYANSFAVSGASPTPEATSSMLFSSALLSLLGARRRRNSDMITAA